MNFQRSFISIILLVETVLSRSLNKSNLIEEFGYTEDSVAIDLSLKNIDSIDSTTFNDFIKLEVLYLEENKLTKLENSLFHKLVNLRELWLESNKIVFIDKNIFNGLSSLELVCMSNNPISVLFPNQVASLCQNNSKCEIEILEKCKRKATTTATAITTSMLPANTTSAITVPNLTLTGHTNWVDALAVLPDGSLASGSMDCTIRIWDLSSGQTIKILKGHSTYVFSLIVLSDGRLVSGSNDIRIWDVKSGQNIKTLNSQTETVWSLAVLLDGRLASGSGFKTIRIWDIKSSQLIKTLNGHSGYVLSLAVLSDGSLVSASRDKTIKIWNSMNWLTIKTLTGHSGWIYSLAILSDGTLASSSTDIRIWDIKSGNLLRVLTKGSTSVANSLALLPNGYLACDYNMKDIMIWNATNGEEIKILKGHTSTIYALAVLSDLRLASGSGDGTVHIWNV